MTMTAEQLEELMADARECGFYLKLRQDIAIELISRVIATEKLAREVQHYTYGNAPLHSLMSALTAYREASK